MYESVREHWLIHCVLYYGGDSGSLEQNKQKKPPGSYV